MAGVTQWRINLIQACSFSILIFIVSACTVDTHRQPYSGGRSVGGGTDGSHFGDGDTADASGGESGSVGDETSGDSTTSDDTTTGSTGKGAATVGVIVDGEGADGGSDGGSTPATVEFSQNLTQVDEGDLGSNNSISLQLKIIEGPQANDVIVTYSVQDPQLASSCTSGSITIPSGFPSAYIQCHSIGNTHDNWKKVVDFQITDVSGADLGGQLTSQVEIIDDDPLPVLSFSASSSDILEGSGSANTVQISYETDRISEKLIGFSVLVQDTGPATNCLGSSQSIQPFATSGAFTCDTIPDNIAGANDQVIFTIAAQTNAQLGQPIHYLTVIDDDVPLVSWAETSFNVAESYQGSANTITMTARLSLPNSTAVQVSYSVDDPNGMSTCTGGSLTIPPQALEASVICETIDNTTDDFNSQVVFEMLSASVEIGSGSSTVTITDNDPEPEIYWQTASQIVSEGTAIGSSFSLAIYWSNASTKHVEVYYDVVDPEGAVDCASGSFVVGQSFPNLLCNTVPNETDNEDRTVDFIITNITNGQIGGQSLHRVTIQDDDFPSSDDFDTKTVLSQNALDTHEDNFGKGVAIEGNWAFVGAPNHDCNGIEESGAVYIYRKTGSNWLYEETLCPLVAYTASQFGQDVAVSGDWLVVGMWGRAETYRLQGGSWNEWQTLQGSVLYEYGDSVDVDANHIIVGAPTNALSGSAHIYSWSGSQWNWIDEFVPDDACPGSCGFETARYGYSVAINGDKAVVGAPKAIVNGARVGTAVVYEELGGNWKYRVTQLQGPPNLQSLDQMGYRVDIHGEKTIVGIRQSSVQDPFTAIIYTAPNWSQHGSAINVNYGHNGGDWGGSVAIDENYIAVGKFHNHGACPEQENFDLCYARTHILEWSGINWTTTNVLIGSEAGTNGSFANSMDLDGGQIIIGAETANVGNNAHQGKALIFD